MAFVSVTALNKFYTAAGTRLHVLRDLDLTVEKGEMVAIMGASGVGKSTLLHVLGGLDVIDSGQVRVGDHEIATMSDEARVAFRNRSIGFVFQFHHLLPKFTALENVTMPGRIRGGQRSADIGAERARELLGEVGLSERLTHRPGERVGRRTAARRAGACVSHGTALAARRRADRRPRRGHRLFPPPTAADDACRVRADRDHRDNRVSLHSATGHFASRQAGYWKAPPSLFSSLFPEVGQRARLSVSISIAATSAIAPPRSSAPFTTGRLR